MHWNTNTYAGLELKVHWIDDIHLWEHETCFLCKTYFTFFDRFPCHNILHDILQQLMMRM